MGVIRYRDKYGNVKEVTVIRGPAGYTPQKGKDYFTPEEVADIVAHAVEQVQVGIAPVLLSGASWYKTELPRSTFTNIRIVDRYEPTGAETEHWNADVEDMGKIRCYVDGTTLIIAGNGSGRIMANADSTSVFGGISQTEYWSNLTTFEGLELLDVRNVTTLRQAFFYSNNLANGLEPVSKWPVTKCLDFKQIFFGVDVSSLDLSGWNVSAAVEVAHAETDSERFKNMIGNCTMLDRLTLNKSFDLSLFFLPIPTQDDVLGSWLDSETGIVYSDTDGDKKIEVADGLPNPYAEGRDITYVAVWEDTSYGDV